MGGARLDISDRNDQATAAPRPEITPFFSAARFNGSYDRSIMKSPHGLSNAILGFVQKSHKGQQSQLDMEHFAKLLELWRRACLDL